MKIKFLTIIPVILLCLTNCSDNDLDVNLADFDEARDYNYEQFLPDENIDYWEYIEECSTDLGGGFEIQTNYFEGEQCITTNCVESYKTASLEHPQYDFFGDACENCCFGLFRFEINEELNFLEENGNSSQDFRPFLGDIDTIDEALWILSLTSYIITYSEYIGKMKEVDSGYEFVSLVYTSYCDPVIVEKHHIFMNREGVITVLDTELFSERNTCFVN